VSCDDPLITIGPVIPPLARAVGDTPDGPERDRHARHLYRRDVDSITSAERMRAASAQTPQSRYVELPATHFVPLQLPDRMSTELGSLVDRCRL
jgi:hypothetical protein